MLFELKPVVSSDLDSMSNGKLDIPESVIGALPCVEVVVDPSLSAFLVTQPGMASCRG